MNLKTFFNGIALFIGLGLAAYSQFNNNSQREVRSVPSHSNQSLKPAAVEQRLEFEVFQLKPNSIYDGDTLRVVRGNEELKIRFCGTDSPEIKQPLGIEARDHLRSLVDINNGELWLIPIEQDRYGRTVAEVYVRDSKDTAINLNLQMVRDGYAWHYERYSGNCPTKNEYVIAERLAREEGLGVWNGSHQAPWDYRQANK